MKTKILIVAGVLSICLSPLSMFAQGALTPPGAPAPTMKSLDQIEPRTPISSPFTYIFNPGSYYVTTNLVGNGYGIEVECDNVTIDLCGFTLQGQAGSTSGIYILGSYTNITIRNGTVTGWGVDGIGFDYPIVSPQNMILENLTVTANGKHGIAIGNNCVVSDCTIQNNNWLGIDVNGNSSRITHNSLTDNDTGGHPGAAGIAVEGNNNLIEDDFVEGVNGNNGIVILTGSSNLVMKNSVIGWGTSNDYIIPQFNDGGPVGTAAASTSPWANIAH
jgi:parallel beta-helix repeat protein